MTTNTSPTPAPLAGTFRQLINPAVRAMLRSPASGLLDKNLLLLRYRGRRTGREIELPVGYLRDGDRILVIVGAAEHKTWWRNFSTPQTVELVLRQHELTAVARLLPAGSSEAYDAANAIRAARPRTQTSHTQPVVIELRPMRTEARRITTVG